MSIALTCECGARFELDESLAGQSVFCPECRQLLEPSGRALAAPRTSLFALASVVVALIGAFTLVGGVVAFVLGLIALVQIHRRRDRLNGAALAMAGLTAGLAFPALTAALLIRPDLVPIDAWVRARTLAGQVDAGGPLEVATRDGGLVVKRPSERWGRVHADRSDDPAVGDLQQKRELLLADVAQHAFLDVGRRGELTTLGDYDQFLDEDLNPPRPPLLGEDAGDALPGMDHRPRKIEVVEGMPLPPVGDWEARAWTHDVQRGGQTWRFLVRAYKKKAKADPRNAEPAYVVRGYAPVRRFPAVEKELKAALRSVSLAK